MIALEDLDHAIVMDCYSLGLSTFVMKSSATCQAANAKMGSCINEIDGDSTKSSIHQPIAFLLLVLTTTRQFKRARDQATSASHSHLQLGAREPKR